MNLLNGSLAECWVSTEKLTRSFAINGFVLSNINRTYHPISTLPLLVYNSLPLCIILKLGINLGSSFQLYSTLLYFLHSPYISSSTAETRSN